MFVTTLSSTRFLASLLVGLALGSARLEAQSTIHVSPQGNDAWLGIAPAGCGPVGPKRTLQAALDAVDPGGLVLVADGLYAGAGNRDLDFRGKPARLQSRGGAERCVVECGGSASEAHRGFWFHTSESASSVVAGFTVRGGVAPFGGAVLCEASSSPTFESCAFLENLALPAAVGGEGGAVRCLASSPRFVACRFARNEARRAAGVGGRGGAIQFVGGQPELRDCVFEANTAGGGGGVHITGVSTLRALRCDFVGNWTADPNFNGGGGLLGSSGTAIELLECRFLGNRTARVAGAVWVTLGASIAATRCSFEENYGYDAACFGVANGSRAQLKSCLFARNRADTFSAALEVWNGPATGAPASARVESCTFADNETSAGYGTIVVLHTSQISVSSSVIWSAAPVALALFDSATAEVAYSVVQGGWPGLGNLDVDPGFVGSGAQPYALGAGSPCVDQGDPLLAIAPAERDLAGACRAWDGDGDALARVDRGAYERLAPRGDLDGDGAIGALDLQLLVAHLHLSSGARVADGDLDGDGDVDPDDLQALLASWGLGCGL
ncbi:MAG: hypothetical protein JNM84_10930 [Planctomycetes bacterium]|nr:hypothetical protein [Planctomycetota bacterium]